MEKEPTEQELLMNAIKNFSKEKKALDEFGYDSADDFFDDRSEAAPSTPLGGRRGSNIRESLSIFKKNSIETGAGAGASEPLRLFSATSNSFYKTTSRSTAISSKQSSRSIFKNYSAKVDDS